MCLRLIYNKSSYGNMCCMYDEPIYTYIILYIYRIYIYTFTHTDTHYTVYYYIISIKKRVGRTCVLFFNNINNTM